MQEAVETVVSSNNGGGEVIIWRRGKPQETLDDYAARTRNNQSLARPKPVECKKTVQESCGACGEFGSCTSRRRQRLMCRNSSYIL